MNANNKKKNNKFISKIKGINLLNEHLYTTNSDLNELFQKYKAIKQKRKLEEEREKVLSNRLKKLISKEKKSSKNKKNKKKYLLNKNKEININNENSQATENKIIYNNNLKKYNDLEPIKANNKTFRKKKINHRNRSVDKSDIKDKNLYNFKSEDRIKIQNLNNKISFISNKSDIRYINNDTSYKKDPYNKIIIKKINNNKEIKYYYTFNNFYGKKNNFSLNKKNLSNTNRIREKKFFKNKDNVGSSDEIHFSQKEINKIIKKDINNEKISTLPNEFKIIKKNHILIENNENIKAKNSKQKKLLNSQSNKFEEKDLKQIFSNINKNSYNKSFLKERNFINKINLKKNIPKSQEKDTKIFKKERTENSKIKNKEFKNFIDNTKIKNTLYNIYNIINKNKNLKNEKIMVHSHTLDLKPKISQVFKPKSLSFNKSLEKKKILFGIKDIKKDGISQKRKIFDDFNLYEIEIKEYIISDQNKNNIKKNFENKDQNIKIIKVAKAPNLDYKNKEKNKKIRRSVIKFNTKKLLSPNRSVEFYDNIFNDDRQNNISYPTLLLKQFKKRGNCYDNILQKKKKT